MTRKAFTKAFKLKVLNIVKQPDSNITQIAREYKVAKSTLYKWIDDDRKFCLNHNHINSKNHDTMQKQFVEANIDQSTQAGNRSIKKLNVELQGMSMSIEGNMPLNTISKLINILEESC